MLERRELELRQRFENNPSQSHPIRATCSAASMKVASRGRSKLKTTPTRRRTFTSRRRLRVAGALQNVEQSTHEVVGVAEAFEDMHDQVENNRSTNAENLKTRLRDQIAVPLRKLAKIGCRNSNPATIAAGHDADGQTETPSRRNDQAGRRSFG